MEALAQVVGRIAAAHVVVQHFAGQRDDDDAAVAVDNRFGQPCRAAGIDNPQRVVKWQPKWFKSGSNGIIFSCRRRKICLSSYCIYSVYGVGRAINVFLQRA